MAETGSNPRLLRSHLARLVAAVAAMAVVVAAGLAEEPNVVPDRGAACVAQGSGVPAERLAMLARGFNLTGWVDQASSRRPDIAVLTGLRARGFTHVRLPVKAELLMQEFSGNEVGMHLAELDRAIDTLIAIGFAVTLDLHPGGRFGPLHVAEPDRAFALLQALWRVLARRYADRAPERVYFEVLNEPTPDRRIWDVQGPRLAETIRREAPNHTIVYGHAHYQRIDALVDVAPLADRNVVHAVHFYDPMIFTHQGLDWSKTDPLQYLHGVPFPAHLSDPPVTSLLGSLMRDGRAVAAALVMTQLRAPWTEDRIDAEFAQAAAWAARHRRPVMVNEFGALGWKALPEHRVRWLSAVRRAAERHCIGWTHWEYADGFGFVRRVDGREVPDETIVDALLKGRS